MSNESKGKVWVLQYSVNDYNQWGNYFHSVYADKPTEAQLREFTECTLYEENIAQLLETGYTVTVHRSEVYLNQIELL